MNRGLLSTKLGESIRALLDEPGTLRFLLASGLLTRQDVVGGEVEIRNEDRRNRNYRVRLASGSGFFVKQARSRSAHATLRNEARFLSWYGSSAHAVTGQPFAPRLRLYDKDRHLLVTDLVEAPPALGVQPKSVDQYSLNHMVRVGELFAVLHRTENMSWAPRAHMPVGLVLHQPSLDLVRDSSPANVALMSIIQAQRGLCASLDGLASSWRGDAIIHGDAKLDNLLFVGDGHHMGAVLVDWELFGLGEPGWDIGSVVGDILHKWSSDTASTVARRAGISSNRQLPPVASSTILAWKLIAAVLQGYGETSDMISDDSRLDRIIVYAAARLLQSAYEAQQYIFDLSYQAVAAVQLATNLTGESALVKTLVRRGGI